jgi:putative hydrolase of the HAD superfamily
MIKAVIFDFGGVLAEEGFREGLLAIAGKRKLNEESFFRTAEETIYKTGYVTGKAKEKAYWDVLLKETGLKDDYRRLRTEIIRRFVLRPDMLSIAGKLRDSDYIVAVLSDQTNWLDEINRKTPFFGRFDYIFNSYVLGKSKRDPSVFRDVAKIIGFNPHQILFVDDNAQHIKRASEAGLRTIHFTGIDDFRSELERLQLKLDPAKADPKRISPQRRSETGKRKIFGTERKERSEIKNIRTK